MGSKRLKAIACAGDQPIQLADERSFREIARHQVELVNESILKVGFDAFGTNMLSDMVNVRGAGERIDLESRIRCLWY